MTHAFVYLLLVLSHIIRFTILALSQKTYGAHILLVQECLLGVHLNNEWLLICPDDFSIVSIPKHQEFQILPPLFSPG